MTLSTDCVHMGALLDKIFHHIEVAARACVVKDGPAVPVLVEKICPGLDEVLHDLKVACIGGFQQRSLKK